MKELLGFAVLTGPLWLIILLLVLGIWLAFKAAKRFTSTGAKVMAALGTFLLVLVLPFADEIAGRIYLRHLCTTKAGVKVYQTVELPGEYWDEQGRPKFYNEKNGNFYLSKDYPTQLKIEENLSILHIDRLVTLLQDQMREEVFAERASYMYWGGWMRRNLSPHNTATPCGEDLAQYGSLIKQVFKPVDSR